MGLVTILLIAVSLALDAFAVSISTGISVPGFGLRQAVKMGLFFGGFQFMMPVIGWVAGTSVSTYIEAVDHWVAFALLAVIGGRMIYGALRQGKETAEGQRTVSLRVGRLTVLALATSIDALAVGVSMAFMDINIWLSAGIIGIVAFCLSVVGGLMGRRLGTLFQRRAELIGGIVLVLIGVNILVEHLAG
ncbi:MAG: manganese efflux pump MntP family protein [Oscillospiraceae bacterium]|nr:manganese efflux pump MntP family protein [Oscillospiraceae bacterium]